MTYTEFLNLTDDQATYEQFLCIEAVYMADERMTKEQSADLWSKRYSRKESKPIPEYLRSVKEAIRNLKDNRNFLELIIKQEFERIDEKIAKYDMGNYQDRCVIANLNLQKTEFAGKKIEEFGNDAKVYIIYKDGSRCIAYGEEIVTREITPKMQHIAYAMYSDGWTEYDTFTGILVDSDTNFFGDLSTDEGIRVREAYYEMIEKIF